MNIKNARAIVARLDLGLHDFVGGVGFAALLHGVAQWSPAAAWVTAGVLLLGVAIAPTLRRRKGQSS